MLVLGKHVSNDYILFPIPDDSLANKHWLLTMLWDHYSEDGQSVVHIQQSYSAE